MNHSWIRKLYMHSINLTLTRVVFELVALALPCIGGFNLTLTRVVFEFACVYMLYGICFNLTLTRVVFEYNISAIALTT